LIVSDDQSGLSSGAVIGIVIAAVCVFLLFIIVFAACFIFGLRGRVFKQQRTREPEDFLDDGGVPLPSDIPIEALRRELPPRYTPRCEVSQNTSGAPTGGAGAQAGRDVYVSTVLPPPYYATSADHPVDTTSVDGSSYEVPPVYQSRVTLGAMDIELDTTRVGRRSDRGRQFNRSMDSFTEYPSMSEILLTSSRSSLPVTGTSSRGTSHGNPSERSDNINVPPPSDQLTIRTRNDNAHLGNNNELILGVNSSSRARSVSLIDMSAPAAAAAVDIPDGGLRQKARLATRKNLTRIDETQIPSSSSTRHGGENNDSNGSHENSRTDVVASEVPGSCSSETADTNTKLELSRTKVRQKRESDGPPVSSRGDRQSQARSRQQALPQTAVHNKETHRRQSRVVLQSRTTEV